ncbi:MAG: hypothetical protein J6W29_00575 [Neisseriaceae bacterium]|nr:hypothetical protein [Neisseriaceae bacterium]
MIVKSKNKEHPEILKVYGIYEIQGEFYYYARPNGYDGLLAYRQNEVEILDNSINNFVFDYNEQGFLLRSKIIENNDFLENLSECNPDAFAKFAKMIAIDKDYRPLKCCRVCGLEYSDYYPWGEDGQSATYDMCDCCGCEFGYEDDEDASDKGTFVYRQEWFNKGVPLFNPESKYLPKQWTLSDLKLQLFNIGVELTDEMIAKIKQNMSV